MFTGQFYPYQPIQFMDSPRIQYDLDAFSLFSRFTTPADDTRKGHINTLIISLKNAGVWEKFDGFYILAAHDAQAARQNWVADQYNLTLNNTPTFTTDRGYTGDGVDDSLLTGFNPSSASNPKFVQNSAHLAVWSRTSGQNNGAAFGNVNADIYPRRTLNDFAAKINDNSSGSPAVASADGSGYFAAVRVDSSTKETYKNGASVGTASVASISVSNFEFRFLGSALQGWSNRQIAAGHMGSSLSDTEVSDVYNAIQTYMTAVGA